MGFSQVPHTIMLVRPAAFGFNPETAASNAFQRPAADSSEVQRKALLEFDRVVALLAANNILTLVFEDTKIPVTTDAVFPNNWITTHEDGRIVLYPMMAPSRRHERRPDIVNKLQEKFQVNEVIDLSSYERQSKYLEGTGSMIFDHVNQIAYACRSDRTHESLFFDLCKQLEYRPILFHATDEDGLPIYHTNVMMWIGESVSGICLDSVHDEAEQDILLNQLAHTGHKVIALSYAQMNAFAGNMFEVRNASDDRFLLLSKAAFDSLLPGQKAEIEKFMHLLPADISTIEECGGGSIRCMVAGIHLPLK